MAALAAAIGAATIVGGTAGGITLHNTNMYNEGKRCWHLYGDSQEAQEVVEHAKFWSDGNKAGIRRDGAWTYWLNGYFDAKAGK